MGVKKSIKKLLNEPTEMRLQEVMHVLRYFGYYLKRVTGSHHIFENEVEDVIVIPAHNHKVKKHYLKLVKSTIIRLYEEKI